jgi:adenylate kinase family enzyme
MKILVTGNAGSGKSSLGKRLSGNLNLPLYGLDKIVWKENWIKTSREERENQISKLQKKMTGLSRGFQNKLLLKLIKFISWISQLIGV